MSEKQCSVLQKCLRSCLYLKSFIIDSFGPIHHNTLVCSDAGQLYISNKGISIYNSLQVNDPYGKLIYNAIESHHIKNGDHSKSFIILLSYVLLHLEKSSERDARQFCFCLQEIKSILLDVIVKDVQFKCNVHCLKGPLTDPFLVSGRKIIKTLLSANIQQSYMHHLENVLHNFLFSDVISLEQFPYMIKSVCDNMDDYVIKDSGKSVVYSNVLNGILLYRDFCLLIPDLKSTKKFRCTVLEMVDFQNFPRNKTILHLQPNCDLHNVLQEKILCVQKILEFLEQNKVKLILTKDKLCESILHQCKRLNISVISNVPVDDLDKVVECYGVLRVQSVEVISQEPIANLCFEVETVEQLIVNEQKCVYLLNPTTLKNDKKVIALDNMWKFMLICGPTNALANDICATVKSILLVLRTWIMENVFSPHCPNEVNTDHQHVVSLLGGMRFEIELYKAMEKFLSNNYLENIAGLLKIIQNGIAELPVCLLKNSYHPDAKQMLTLHFNEMVKLQSSFGINARSGCYDDLQSCFISETLVSKINLVFNTLDLANQILRIESTVFLVKPLLVKTENSKESDDDVE